MYLKIGGESVLEKFKPHDYSPLINPRVHNIGEHSHNILNVDFKRTYCQFLRYCLEKGELDPRENLYLACYLILQDRIKEALSLVSKMNDEDYTNSSIMVIQYDYLKAYLSLYQEYPTFETARTLSEKYKSYHIKNWRNLFGEISKQLQEFDGASSGEIIDADKKDKVVKKLKTEDAAEKLINKFKAKIENGKIIVQALRPEKVSLKFYFTDLEFLVSKDPFLSSDMKNFVFVQPND